MTHAAPRDRAKAKDIPIMAPLEMESSLSGELGGDSRLPSPVSLAVKVDGIPLGVKE